MADDAKIEALQALVDDMQKRLKLAEDREAIWRLVMAMQSAIDGRDIRAYAEGFTEDGVWAGVVGRGVGPKGVEEILGKYMKPWESHSTRTWHTTLDFVVDVDGDTATSTSKFQHITHDEKGELRVWHLGAYDDRLVRTPAGWKFTRRNAYVIVPYMEPKFQLVD
ncbi:MAG: nuclear transport factor 2 family protein [Sphingomonadales bacterium]|nr:nuclear transport factor 2 family protein [Sphingomonadales bacterium]